jgi:hypothetical protein
VSEALHRTGPGTPVARGVPDPGPGVSMRAVALPVEHGGWGFVIEALVVALVVVPGVAAAGLATAALGAFLARHPAKLALADLLRHRHYPRTRWAALFVLVYGAVALGGLGLAASRAPARFWPPLAVAAALAFAQLHYDARLRGRELAPELLGCVAPGAIAAAAMLAEGWRAGPALAVWMTLAARAVASVLYVRSRLRLDRGVRHSRTPAIAAHLVALVLVAAQAAGDVGPWLSLPAFLLLLARAVHGLSARRRIVRPQVLGLRELALGLATAAVLSLGHRFGF